MRVRGPVLPVLLLLLCGRAWAADPVRVVVVTPYPQTFRAARDAFDQRFGGGLIELTVATDLPCASLDGAAVLYLHGAYWSREMEGCAPDVQRLQRRGLLVGGTIPAIFQASWRVPASAELNAAAPYLRFGGQDNLVGFLGALHNAVNRAAPLKLVEAEPQAEAGIYHPQAPNPFFSLDDYLTWYAAARLVPADARLVGLTFFQTNHFFGDLAHVDALVAALERRGIGVIPAFGWPLKAAQPFLFRDGMPAIDLLFCLNLLMPSPENAQLLADHGIHAINLTTTTASAEEWASSERGLPPGRAALQLGTPERTGATEPILIATTQKSADGTSQLVPVSERIEHAARRAARWLALRHRPNADKRVALVYFNSPPGKGTVGASYLDVFPSLQNILATLQREGYLTADLPDATRLQELLLLGGRNVGDYAPGELDALARDHHVTLLPLEQYETWYRDLPAAFRAATERVWGAPSAARLMTVRRNGRTFFVIPGVRLGNVFVGPQPLRDAFDLGAETAHSTDRPAPHVYVAYYLWLQKTFAADALVHIGRHGTLEWLPGKDVAQSESDPGEVLVGDLPHVYYYIVDGGGEFLQAKRRASAVIVSHLTPLLANAGLGPEYARLRAALDNRRQLDDGEVVLREQYEREIAAEATRLRLFEKLGMVVSGQIDPTTIDRLEEYVEETEEASIPVGLHAIGGVPSAPVLKDAVRQYLLSSLPDGEAAQARPFADEWADAVVQRRPAAAGDLGVFERVRAGAEAWVQAIEQSGARELEALVQVLAGKGLATGVAGDPLRVPDAVPTGRNLHDLDPRVFPTKAAWEIGRRLADSLIEGQRQKTGRYPETVSFVLWYGESNRTQGIAEAQALRLLGVEPVWNGRGQVDDVKLVPEVDLGRPRVDVVLTMSGLYRDGLPEKLDLLDRAVKLAANAPDDNAVRRNAQRVARQLTSSGVADEVARQVSLARLFGPAPQAFGTRLNAMMESSRDNNDQALVAAQYLDDMNFAYGQGLWGSRVAGTLAAHLAGNSVVVHSRSTNLYGVLDNDETYQFAGGLAAATAVAAGRAPDVVISNARQAGREKLEELQTFLARELDSRAFNPKWIEGMKTAGYSGAREMARTAENLYGLRAAAPSQVDPSVWQQMFEVYVNDSLRLGLPGFFDANNPHAQQMLAARLLEIDRQGVYAFGAEDKRQLLQTYVASVTRFGASCYANACANPRLRDHIVSETVRLSAVPPEDLARLQRQMRTATTLPPAQRVAAIATLPTPRSAPSFTFTTIIDTVRSSSPVLAAVVYRLDASWLLLLVPALMSPLYSFVRLRRRRWSPGLDPWHRSLSNGGELHPASRDGLEPTAIER